MEDEKAQRILAEIEDKILNGVNLGFDPEVLDVLNNFDASEREIEILKAKIGEEILARLFSIANSVYYGQLKRGSVDTFYKVVSRLGMDFTRVLIIFLAIAGLSRDKEVKIIFARSFATSILGGRILAQEFGLKVNDTKKVELGGLLLEIGRIIIAIYRSLYNEDYEQAEIGEEFIAAYHSLLGVKIIEKFKLPEYLKDIISMECLTLDAELMALSGIVMAAYGIVDLSFRKFGNKLVIASPMPDPDGMVIHTTGAVIEDTFKAVGLANYIKIIRRPLPHQ
ncbi:MAG: HDOD domain-containing protein [Deltaproteobacteria bacterium]|nr:HDOD domain-containing protein [Deltaproteobacteria bacterium]